MRTPTQLALNVWNDGEQWKMAIYGVYDGSTDTSHWHNIEVTEARLNRYLELSQDDDWWVYSGHPDFYYIWLGERPL